MASARSVVHLCSGNHRRVTLMSYFRGFTLSGVSSSQLPVEGFGRPIIKAWNLCFRHPAILAE